MSLPLFDVAPQSPAFDGRTYEPARDAVRLGSQLAAVKALMADGAWRSLEDIQTALRRNGLHASEAGISARLRDLRKSKFGGYDIERRHEANGLWLYRMPEGK